MKYRNLQMRTTRKNIRISCTQKAILSIWDRFPKRTFHWLDTMTVRLIEFSKKSIIIFKMIDFPVLTQAILRIHPELTRKLRAMRTLLRLPEYRAIYRKVRRKTHRQLLTCGGKKNKIYLAGVGKISPRATETRHGHVSVQRKEVSSRCAQKVYCIYVTSNEKST